jgi:hypothetical protein
MELQRCLRHSPHEGQGGMPSLRRTAHIHHAPRGKSIGLDRNREAASWPRRSPNVRALCAHSSSGSPRRYRDARNANFWAGPITKTITIGCRRRTSDQLRQPKEQLKRGVMLVGVAGFEPATTRTPSVCATRLRYTPTEGKNGAKTQIIIASAAKLQRCPDGTNPGPLAIQLPPNTLERCPPATKVPVAAIEPRNDSRLRKLNQKISRPEEVVLGVSPQGPNLRGSAILVFGCFGGGRSSDFCENVRITPEFFVPTLKVMRSWL